MLADALAVIVAPHERKLADSAPQSLCFTHSLFTFWSLLVSSIFLSFVEPTFDSKRSAVTYASTFSRATHNSLSTASLRASSGPFTRP